MNTVVFCNSRWSRATSSCMSRRISGSSARERLVEEQDLGIVGERAGQADALLHAAGQLVGVALAQPLEADEVEHLAGPRAAARALALPCTSSPKATLSSTRRCGEQAEVLEHHRHLVRGAARAAARRVAPVDVLAVDQDLAGGRLDQAAQAAHERRLARAREPHDDEDLAAATSKQTSRTAATQPVRAQLGAGQVGVGRADDALGVRPEHLPDALGARMDRERPVRSMRCFIVACGSLGRCPSCAPPLIYHPRRGLSMWSQSAVGPRSS